MSQAESIMTQSGLHHGPTDVDDDRGHADAQICLILILDRLKRAVLHTTSCELYLTLQVD